MFASKNKLPYDSFEKQLLSKLNRNYYRNFNINAISTLYKIKFSFQLTKQSESRNIV